MPTPTEDDVALDLAEKAHGLPEIPVDPALQLGDCVRKLSQTFTRLIGQRIENRNVGFTGARSGVETHMTKLSDKSVRRGTSTDRTADQANATLPNRPQPGRIGRLTFLVLSIQVKSEAPSVPRAKLPWVFQQ